MLRTYVNRNTLGITAHIVAAETALSFYIKTKYGNLRVPKNDACGKFFSELFGKGGACEFSAALVSGIEPRPKLTAPQLLKLRLIELSTEMLER